MLHISMCYIVLHCRAAWYGARMDDKRDQTVTVRLTADEVSRIDQQAASEGRDRSGMIRWAIQRYLQEEQR